MSDLNPYEEGLALELQAAQKRIEALIEQLDAVRKDADEAEAYAWELEQRLGAALEPAPTDAAQAYHAKRRAEGAPAAGAKKHRGMMKATLGAIAKK